MQLQKGKNRLFVQLASALDYNRLEGFSRNAHLQEVSKPYGNCFYEAENLQKAKELCERFIEYFNLSSSNWSGGIVINEQNEFIASISYNGKIWDNQNWKVAKEIKLC